MDQIIQDIVEKTAGKIKLAIPLGLGKPNQFVNALYQYVKQHPDISLEIYTALSLEKPSASSDMEHRFLAPFVERVYGNYEELAYMADIRKQQLPPHIQVYEFFFRPGAMLKNAYAQQHYISTNYTHVARDLAARGVNVFAQMVSREQPNGPLSLSCNPEVTLELVPYIQQRRAEKEAVFCIAQVHPELPYMTGDAEVEPDFFDYVIDTAPAPTLFSTPNMPVSLQDHFIGLNASTLIADGGTLQIGIGALGDAVAHHLLHRHENHAEYQALLNDMQYTDEQQDLIEAEGGTTAFQEGLYGCSEMITQALLGLLEGGVIKREVDQQGTLMHGGFFLGSQAFYRRLAALSEEERQRINMTRIGFVNHLYGQETLKREQRVRARFVNTVFAMTALGAAVSDQLESGAVLSGVGGQYNFVAQAHELDGARSILLMRAWREREGKAESNILWRYGHTTIPRHLRDVVVTEYGMADLRGKTDAEVIAAMINVADSRFQEALLEKARSTGKLPMDYQIPEPHRHNFPERLARIAANYERDVFSPFPLGTDFTDVEQALIRALSWLKEKTSQKHYLELVRTAAEHEPDTGHFAPHLERMGLASPKNVRERLMVRLLVSALGETWNSLT